MIIQCEYCGCDVEKHTGHVNRARKMGNKLYCTKAHSALARSLNRSDEEKKKIKSDYDKEYRNKNLDKKKVWAKEYFKKTYDPVKAAVERKKTMPRHVEYCRQPKYKEYKKKYDEKYHAKKKFGEFAECFLIIKKIEKEYNQREVRQINNLHNKSQKRKRKWKQDQPNSLQRT